MDKAQEQVSAILKSAMEKATPAAPAEEAEQESAVENSENFTAPDDSNDSHSQSENSENKSEIDGRSKLDQVSDVLNEAINPTPTEAEDDPPIAAAEESETTSNLSDLESLGAPEALSEEQIFENTLRDMQVVRDSIESAKNNPELARLRIEDPGRAALEEQRILNKEHELQKAEQYYQVAYQQYEKKKADSEQERVRTIVNGWDNDDVYRRESIEMVKYLRHAGYSDYQIQRMTADDVKTLHSRIIKRNPPKKLKRKGKRAQPTQATRKRVQPKKLTPQGQVAEVLKNAGVNQR